MTNPNALAPHAQTDREVLREVTESLARSPMDVRPGEAVLLDRRGAAVGRQRYARLVAAWTVALNGAALVGAGLMMTGVLLPGSLLVIGGVAPSLLGKYRGVHALMATELAVRQGRLEDGQRQLHALPALRRRNPGAYCFLAGQMASHRGDHASALTWWREAAPRMKGFERERLKLSIAMALMLSGQVAEARRELDSVSLPPQVDEVLVGWSLARTMLALCDPAAARPTDDALHASARRALEYTHSDTELAAIGWLFDRSGDPDMARFLAGEARDRMRYPYLATWWPALHQWLHDQAPQPHGPDAS